MKSEFGREQGQQPFEEKIRKVGEPISLSHKVREDDPSDSDEDAAFNGAALSDCVLGREWNSPEEDAAWSNL